MNGRLRFDFEYRVYEIFALRLPKGTQLRRMIDSPSLLVRPAPNDRRRSHFSLGRSLNNLFEAIGDFLFFRLGERRNRTYICSN